MLKCGSYACAKASIPPAVFVVDPSNPAPPAQFSTPNATRSSQLNFPLIDENSFFEMCDESEKIVPTVLRASWTGTDQVSFKCCAIVLVSFFN